MEHLNLKTVKEPKGSNHQKKPRPPNENCSREVFYRIKCEWTAVCTTCKLDGSRGTTINIDGEIFLGSSSRRCKTNGEYEKKENGRFTLWKRNYK